MRNRCTWVLAVLAVLTTFDVEAGQDCVVVDIDRIGPERLAAVQAAPGVEWWVEADDRLLVCGAEGWRPWDVAGLRVLEAHPGIERERLRLVRGLDPETAAALRDAGGSVLMRGGRLALVSFATSRLPEAIGKLRLAAVADNVVLARQAANAAPRRVNFPRDTGDMVNEVDAQRWFDDVVSLAAYSRYTLGTDILAARDWLVAELDALPGLAVTTQEFAVSGTTGYNVIATLTGTTRPDDWYIVGGHYDAYSYVDVYGSSFGAEDNASGCAGVLEIARILTAHPPEASVLLMCWSGEEQGLVGSTAHAASLVASGDDAKVVAVLDMDMIGYTSDADLDCLLESEAFASDLVATFEAAAAQYTTLRIVTAYGAWGSDHVPYLDRGMLALLAIENDWDEYPCYHSNCDLPANITLSMGEQVLRMNVAALAGLVGASDPGLIFRDGFETGDMAAWSSAVP